MSTDNLEVLGKVFSCWWVVCIVVACAFSHVACNKSIKVGVDTTTQQGNPQEDSKTNDRNNGSDDDISKSASSDEDTEAFELFRQEIGPKIDWIKVPAGTFTWGSKPGSPARIPAMNTEVEVVLTNSFEMAATEITIKQWLALDYLTHRVEILNNTYDRPPSDNYPMDGVNFFEALTWCNKLSKLHNLQECYDLSDCTFQKAQCNVDIRGEICNEYLLICGDKYRKFTDIHSCPGYRLPSIAEWQYAAKAGTHTHTWAGDYTLNEYGKISEDDPVADRAGWNMYNSGGFPDSYGYPHEVAQKEPNPWGFYDILGNVAEWVDWFDSTVIYRNEKDEKVEPVGTFVNPIGSVSKNIHHKEVHVGRMGGYYNSYPDTMTPTFPSGTNAKYPNDGFRPVRTLFEE